MSIARKAGLLVGVIGAAATIASTAEGGEGGRGRTVYVPYFVESPPVRLYQPPPVVIYQPPVTYAPAYPAYPSPEPGVNLNFNIPLR